LPWKKQYNATRVNDIYNLSKIAREALTYVYDGNNRRHDNDFPFCLVVASITSIIKENRGHCFLF